MPGPRLFESVALAAAVCRGLAAAVLAARWLASAWVALARMTALRSARCVVVVGVVVRSGQFVPSEVEAVTPVASAPAVVVAVAAELSRVASSLLVFASLPIPSVLFRHTHGSGAAHPILGIARSSKGRHSLGSPSVILGASLPGVRI